MGEKQSGIISFHVNPSVTHAINSRSPGSFRYWSQFSKDDLPHPAWEGAAWNWWNSGLQKYNRQQWFLMSRCLYKENGGTSQCKPEAGLGTMANKQERGKGKHTEDWCGHIWRAEEGRTWPGGGGVSNLFHSYQNKIFLTHNYKKIKHLAK